MTEHATCNVCKTLHVARPSYSASSLILWRSFTLSVIRDSRTLPESARASASTRDASGTVGLHRTLAGSFREFQPPCRARRARNCAPYLARFLADQFKAARRRFSFFSPVADLVCNLPSQRALHSAGRTHLPPQNAEIIPPSPAPRQLLAPARTGTRCRTLSAKTQIPHHVCKCGAKSSLRQQP